MSHPARSRLQVPIAEEAYSVCNCRTYRSAAKKPPSQLHHQAANLGHTGSTSTSQASSLSSAIGRPRPDITEEMSRCHILAMHNKVFEDNFMRRAAIGYTWLDARTHFLLLERISPDHSPTLESFPVRKKSHRYPQAIFPLTRPMFASLGTLQRSLVLSSSPQIYEPPWYYEFWIGTDTQSMTAHVDLAINLVDNSTWSNESIAKLARHFCWRGAHGMSPELGAVADFAEIVHIRFGSRWGKRYAEEFMRQLRDITIEAFKVIWTSVGSLPKLLNPPVFSDHISYISAGLSLSAFVGDLSAKGLILVSEVHLCLWILVWQAHTVEHLHAVHLLLMHAGKRAWEWDVRRAQGFVEMLGRRVRMTIARRGGGRASFLGRWVPRVEVEAWLGEMRAMVVRWTDGCVCGSRMKSHRLD